MKPPPQAHPPTQPRPHRLWWRAAWALLGLGSALVAWQWQVLPLAWQLGGWHARAAEPATPSLNLSGYRVGIEARPIVGIEDNTSGLTYHPGSGTLFAAINRPPAVAELSTAGELLRLMPLDGVRDPEGITHVQDGLFVVGDERGNRLHWVRIDAASMRLSPVEGLSLGLSTSPMKNQGIEGVSWDHVGRRLFVSQEIWPRRIWVISGLDPAAIRPKAPTVEEWRPAPGSSVPLADYSSVSLHEASGQLLVLSKLTGMVLAYAPDGSLAGTLPLWPGFRGLRQRVPQAEGVAVDSRGHLYLVSEPNLFYRFEPTLR